MREQALMVDSAWISTIHGMCSRILKRHALDLGIDPSFKVAGVNEARALLEQATEEVVGAASRSHADAVLVTVPSRNTAMEPLVGPPPSAWYPWSWTW